MAVFEDGGDLDRFLNWCVGIIVQRFFILQVVAFEKLYSRSLGSLEQFDVQGCCWIAFLLLGSMSRECSLATHDVLYDLVLGQVGDALSREAFTSEDIIQLAFPRHKHQLLALLFLFFFFTLFRLI